MRSTTPRGNQMVGRLRAHSSRRAATQTIDATSARRRDGTVLSRRPKNWQGAKNAWKQWLAYTELDSNYHQDRLDKEDIKDTCYSYMIDKTLYDMILAAPEAEQPRKIEKLEGMEEDDEEENEEHGD